MPPAPPPYGERREASLLVSFLSWALLLSLFLFLLCRILRVWKALGGSTCRILRVWKALGGSICRIAHAARRPADPVNFYPCFILRKSTTRLVFARLSAHCAYRRVLSRINSAPAARHIAPITTSIPNRLLHPGSGISPRRDHLNPNVMPHAS